MDDTLFTDARNFGTSSEYWKVKELYSFNNDTLTLILVESYGDEIAIEEAPRSDWIPFTE